MAVVSASTDGYLSSADWTTFNNKVSGSRTINTTAPLSGGGDLSADRTFSITQSSGTTDGYLSATDWTTFNSKESALTFSGPLSRSVNTISIPAADSGTNGYLSSTDWSTFNGKEDAITAATTAEYYRGDKTFQTLDTDVVPEGLTNLYYSDARADARIALQAGQAGGLATLDGTGKVSSSQLPLITITDTYVVVDQTAMLALTAQTGDVAVRTDENKSYILAGTDSSVLADWQELLTPTDTVQSVNGQTGSVSLTTDDIPEGTNLYYTDALARAAISGTAPVAYDNSTGVISMAVADTTTDGYLSSTDWNTFNGKENALTFSAPFVRTVDAISMPAANSTTDGYLSATDWTTFNSKLSSVLTSAHIFVGNGSNAATDVALSGDATLANTGALTIANSAVTLAKMADIATGTLLGRSTALTGNVEVLTTIPSAVQDNITRTGTITSGVWNGTSIGTAYTDAKIKTVTGTANRLSIGGTSTDPTFDIDSAYVGQTSITTLGTIASGTWNGGVIGSTYGGTGVNNAGTITNASNTTITGGGTLGLGGFTLTVPATGTAVLGTGANTRIGFWSGTNTMSSSAQLTYTTATGAFSNSASVAGNMISTFENTNSGTTAQAQLAAGNGTYNSLVQMLGTSFTASGLNQPSLTKFSSNSPVGVLFQSSVASTKFWWSIGGGASTDEYMRLTTAGLSIKTQADPTAYLHLAGGTTAASTGPLKFTAGTNMTTAEAGAMEYDGTSLYFSPSTTRRTIAFLDGGQTFTSATWNGTAIDDAYLASSYIKADGTRPLTAGWDVGAFAVTAKSFAVDGTAGDGYVNLLAQASNAAAPAATGLNLFSGSAGNLSWAVKNGTDTFARSFTGTLTADRNWALPDVGGTIALIDGGQTFTAATWNGTSIGTAYTDAKIKTVTGTANRLSIGGTSTDPTFDIDSAYVGQTSITTLGTITTGVWNGTDIPVSAGGTGLSTFGGTNTILYTSAADTLASDANFTWNGSVFIAGASAAVGNEIALFRKDQNVNTNLDVINATNGTAAKAALIVSNSATISGNLSMQSLSTAYTTSGILVADAAVIQSTKTAGLNIGTNNATSLTFWTNNTQRVEITDDGYLGIGTAGVTNQPITSSFSFNGNLVSRFINSSTGTAGISGIGVQNSAVLSSFSIYSTGYTTNGLLTAGITRLQASAAAGMLLSATTSAAPIIFATSGIAAANERMRITDTDITATNNFKLTTAGNGFYVKEGTNATMGTATLVGGTATVSTTKVTANSRIFLTTNTAAGTVGTPYVSARSAGTSFTITSTSGSDTSTVAWIIIEPS